MMTGLTWKSLKHHYSLIPLFVFVGAGAIGATWYLARIAINEPEVSWARKKNPHPWEAYRDKQYKLLAVEQPLEPSPAPKY